MYIFNALLLKKTVIHLAMQSFYAYHVPFLEKIKKKQKKKDKKYIIHGTLYSDILSKLINSSFTSCLCIHICTTTARNIVYLN